MTIKKASILDKHTRSNVKYYLIRAQNNLATTVVNICKLIIPSLAFSEAKLFEYKLCPRTPREIPRHVGKSSGYSALFTALERQVQDDIISRTEQTL